MANEILLPTLPANQQTTENNNGKTEFDIKTMRTVFKFVYKLQAFIKWRKENNIEDADKFTIEDFKDKFRNESEECLLQSAYQNGLLASEQYNGITKYFFGVLMSGLRF